MKKYYLISLLFFFVPVTTTTSHAMQQRVGGTNVSYTAGIISTDVMMEKILSFCDYNIQITFSILNQANRKYFLDFGTIVFKTTARAIVKYKKAKKFLKTFNGKTNVVIMTNIFNGKDNKRVISRIKKIINKIKNLNKLQFDAVRIPEKQWRRLFFKRKSLFKRNSTNIIKHSKRNKQITRTTSCITNKGGSKDEEASEIDFSTVCYGGFCLHGSVFAGTG